MKNPKYLVTISNLFTIKKNLLTFASRGFSRVCLLSLARVMALGGAFLS
jgi:hypothetical protein